MQISAKKMALLALLREMHSSHPELGLIRKENIYNEGKLILIINDTPFINVGVQKVIAKLLEHLARKRILNLVACDGAFGDVEIDTNWLGGIKDLTLQSEIVDTLLEQGKLTGLEYCHILSDTPFVLYGPEDERLYKHAANLWNQLSPLRNYLDQDKTEARIYKAMNLPEFKPLFTVFQEFLDIDKKRSKIIASNLIKKMESMNTDISAIICRGNLPENIANELMYLGISFMIIDPSKISPDDKITYEKNLSEQLKF